MNHRPNITSYYVCIEDGGRNGGKSGFMYRTTKYYQFWKFGDGIFKHLDLGRTSAHTCFYPWTAVNTDYNTHKIPHTRGTEYLK